MIRLGILGSGKGSNFAALLGKMPRNAEVAIVLSDRADSGILRIAAERGIPWDVIHESRRKARLSEEVEAQVVKKLREAGVHLVVLAGFMRLLGRLMLDAYPRRIINIHPSLLPAFRGLEAWKQALDAGVQETGCTVHFVDEGMDTGEIIAQERVPVLEGDTPEVLHARIQEAEHRLLPQVVADLCRVVELGAARGESTGSVEG